MDRTECRWPEENHGANAFPCEAPWANDELPSTLPSGPDLDREGLVTQD